MTEKRNLPTIETKLNQNNYNLWVYHMKLILEDEKQHDPNAEVPENGHPFRIKETARSRRFIFQNTEKEIQTSLIHFDKAIDMWDYLYQTYSGQNAARKNQGIKRLALFRYQKPTIEQNLETLMDIISDTEIAAGDKNISIVELGIHMFLNALPSRFSSVRAILDSKNEAITLISVRTALVAEEERHRERESKSNEFAGAAFKKCSHGRNSARCWNCHPDLHPSKATCKDCKEIGHFSANSSRCKSHKEKPNGFSGSVGQKRSSEEDSFGPNFAAYTKKLKTNDLRNRLAAMGVASNQA
jgi:hypothetical protein